MAKRNPWLIGLAAAALLFGPGLIQLARMSWHQHVIDRDLARLEQTRRDLLTEREHLASDPVYVEGLIRSTFKVAKPGELVVPLDSDDTRAKSR